MRYPSNLKLKGQQQNGHYSKKRCRELKYKI